MLESAELASELCELNIISKSYGSGTLGLTSSTRLEGKERSEANE